MATANEIEIRVSVDDRTRAPFAKVEQRLKASAKRAGEGAGQSFSDGFSKTKATDRKSGLFKAFEKAFMPMQSLGSDLFSTFTSLGGVVLKVGGAFAAVGAIAGPALIGIGAAAAAAGGLLMTGLVGAIGLIGVMVAAQKKEVGKAFGKLFADVGSDLKKMMQDSGFIDAVLALAGQARSAFKSMKPALTEMFKAVSPQLKTFTSGVTDLVKNALPGITVALKRMDPVMAGFRSLLGDIGTGIGGMFAELSKHAPGLGETMRGFGAVFNEVGPALGSFIGTIADEMGPVLREIAPSLGQFVRDVGPVLAQAIKDTAPYIPGLIDGFKQIAIALAPLIPGLTQLAQIVIPPLAEAIKWVASVIADVPVALTQLKDNAVKVWNDFVAKVVWVKDAVVTAFNWIKDTIAGAWTSVKDTTVAQWNNIKTTVSGAWDSIKNAVVTKGGELLGWIKGLPGRILGALGGLGSLLWNSGVSLVNGFLGGLKSAWSKVTGFVSGAIQKVRDFFPFSPAKDGPFSGMGYVSHSGKALTEDFAASLRAGMPKVHAAASDVLSAGRGGLIGSASALTSSAPGRSGGSPTTGGATTGRIVVEGTADSALAALLTRMARTGELRFVLES